MINIAINIEQNVFKVNNTDKMTSLASSLL